MAVIARVPFDEGTPDRQADARQPLAGGRLAQHLLRAGEPGGQRARAERLRPLVPAGMTMAEMALRFILASPDVATVIPGMRKARHVDANLAASGRGPLAADLVAALRAHRWDRTPNQTS